MDVNDFILLGRALPPCRPFLSFAPGRADADVARGPTDNDYLVDHESHHARSPSVQFTASSGRGHMRGRSEDSGVLSSDVAAVFHPLDGRTHAPSTAATAHIDDSFESGENVIAGAISGLIAETLMHPFDTVSHRAKVHPSSAYGNFAGAFRLIYRQEGIRGYFAGVSATLAQSPPANAAYFLAYESMKTAGLQLTGGKYDAAVFFIAGGLSELASSLCFVPFDVVKSRLQLGENPHRATGGMVSSTHNYPSLRAAFSGIYRESSWRGLTAGWGAGLVLDMAFSGTQFLLYEQLKRSVRRQTQRDLTVAQTLLCGCVSGGIAAALTNPLDVVASRLQCQDARRSFGTNFGSVLQATVAEGRIALWRGTLPRIAQIAPLSALSFGVYEFMRRYLKDTAFFR